ncbi:MAG: hypothetical protein ACE5F8_05710, partial [Woeseiaceae bacterium]
MAKISERLASTGDAEFIIASAYVNPPYDPGTGQSRFEQALTIAPRNGLVLWNASMQCGHEAGAAYCDDAEFLKNAKEILGTNGAWWLRVAAARKDAGDEAGALRALQQSSIQPEFDSLFIEHVFLFDRALAATIAWEYRVRIIAATGFASTTPDFLHGFS